jgi:hypothetical protein
MLFKEIIFFTLRIKDNPKYVMQIYWLIKQEVYIVTTDLKRFAFYYATTHSQKYLPICNVSSDHLKFRIQRISYKNDLCQQNFSDTLPCNLKKLQFLIRMAVLKLKDKYYHLITKPAQI